MSLGPIKKSVTVPLPQGAAFSLFVDRIGEWWPLESHALSPSTFDCSAKSCVIEPAKGGRVYEIAENGQECDWGEIVAWSPPSGFSFTWHVGVSVAEATEIEIAFEAVSDKETKVRLTHRNWEMLGDKAEATRESYDTGWDTVFVEPYGSICGV